MWTVVYNTKNGAYSRSHIPWSWEDCGIKKCSIYVAIPAYIEIFIYKGLWINSKVQGYWHALIYVVLARITFWQSSMYVSFISNINIKCSGWSKIITSFIIYILAKSLFLHHYIPLNWSNEDCHIYNRLLIICYDHFYRCLITVCGYATNTYINS